MRLPRLGKPSPAMVVALLALFVALSGASYAAVKLKNNSVRSKNIAPNAVKGVDADEATFGKVPTAGRADSAVNADRAASATTAIDAVDAGSVDGVDSSAFPRVFSGRGDTVNGQPDVIFSVPSMGVQIRDVNNAVDNSTFEVRNARSPGGGSISVDHALNSDGLTPDAVAPGSSSPPIPGKSGGAHGSPAFVTDPAAPNTVLAVWCELGFTAKITCVGILSG